jgi:hypothetical protein
MKTKRRKHHYVPVWYQKRFLSKGQNAHYYLNLHPFKKLPDGREIKRREVYSWGPRSCFRKKDLYTTRVFGIRNDEIEEFLFGEIDDVGSKAINALVAQDFKLLSKHFTGIFEYMDAQKLRTPKGLDWIKTNYFQLSHIELMLEMQYLRTMHCTMWVEGVMEIVSAEASDVKFIISDHPVTIYNPACPPDSEICTYPNDPPTAWMASQTIYPLDINHCFILTNLEYARDPNSVNPTISRTNPRYFAQTITRWDIVIRDRKLTPEEVCAINYIIKTRARKYIAGARLEWLYPEKYLTEMEWTNLRKVALPANDKIWQFGGEIYVGGKNGKLAWYQDEFGRRFTRRENGENPFHKYTIKERNRILFNAIGEIFGFSKGKDWNNFRSEITDEQVRELHKVVGALWHPDTEIMRLLPNPSAGVSALYCGTTDPRIVPLTVVGYSLYVERIIIISPFQNPWALQDAYSPVASPAQYKYETIKNVALMMQIMPLIEADIVEMIPDPCDFDPFFRKRIYKMAEARMKGWKPTDEDIERGSKLMFDDSVRFIWSLPPENLKKQFKKAMPDLLDQELEKLVEYTQKMRHKDPLALLQPPTPGKDGGQLNITHMGGNLEMALYLAQITGSYVYTDAEFRWREILSAVLKRPQKGDYEPWQSVEEALNEANFLAYSEPDSSFLCHLREKGTFREFRKLLRDIFVSGRDFRDAETAAVKAKGLAEGIKHLDIRSEWDAIDKEYVKYSGKRSQDRLHKVKVPINHRIPRNGFSLNTITQLLLTHGSSTAYWNAVPIAAFLDWQNMKVCTD